MSDLAFLALMVIAMGASWLYVVLCDGVGGRQ